jgi:hypothetical protein
VGRVADEEDPAIAVAVGPSGVHVEHRSSPYRPDDEVRPADTRSLSSLVRPAVDRWASSRSLR